MSSNSQSHPLCKKIEQNLRLPPNQFQIFLERIYDEEPIQTCSMISLMQFESRPKQQKQKLATSFNYLIQRSFLRNDKNPELWRVFVQNIAVKKGKSQKQQIELWRIHKITQKSLKKFVQSFQQQFTPIFQQIYYKLNFSSKILLQSIIIHSDVDGQSRLLFLKETFQQYIHMGIELLFGLSELNSGQILQEMENRLSEYLLNLKQCLLYLHLLKQYLVNKVCRNQQLFKLIYQCIFLESFRDNVKIYPKQSKQGPSKYPLIFSQSGSFHLQQCYNNIKSIGLQIFCTVLNRYSRKSTMAQFDESKFLGMMQNLIPCMINQIISTKTNKLSLSQNQKLTIAMLCCIRKSSEFLFMNNFMWANYKNMFWNIIYPLLIVSDQQKRQYQDDPEAFIGQAETLVEKQFEETDKVQSCKTYAGFLLESLVDNVDGAVTTITNQVIGLLDFCVNGVQNQISRDLKHVYKIKESYEGCLTVLQVLSTKIKRRQQLLQKLRYIFIECRAKILKLKSLDKARTILYLCYNFDEIFRQSRPKQTPILYSPVTQQYYQFVASCLQQNQNLTKCSIIFYETYCTLQPQAMIILDRIIQLIESTKQVDILTCMTKILYELISTLDIDRIKCILDRCIKRLFIDNEQYIRSAKHNAVYSNISMLKCLQSVKIIALYCKNIKNQSNAKDIMGLIWKVFDLFDFIDIANYGEDLIKIFDAVLSYLKIIDGPYFFQFLTNFAMYHQKQKQVGRLFYTYLALIIKGHQFLSSDPEGHNILNHIIQNLMIVVKKLQKRSIVAITLIQYILNKFPKVEYNHEEIYQRTLQILQNQKENEQNKQLIASIYNLWIMGSSISQIYDLGHLDQLDLNGVYGYHARVFSVAMNVKIISLYNQIRNKQQLLHQNLQKILYLLRKNIQFLKIFTQKTKDMNSKITTKIEQYTKQNPSQKLRQTFLFLKKNLREEDYNEIIKEIQTDITRQELNGMLSKYVRESRVIFKFK